MACFIHIIVIYFCLNHTSAKLSIPLYKNVTHERIISCAIDIANENFNFRKLTIVFSNNVDGLYINKFLRYYKGTVNIETKKDGPYPGQVVVIVDSFKSFMKVLSKLKPDLKGKTLISSGAKFLIILLISSRNIEHIGITNILWSYHATNALIVASDDNKIAIKTYFPNKNHLNCHDTKPVPIRYCHEKGTNIKNLYTDKMNNMNGCPLYISTNKLYHPATEQKIPLQIIKKSMVRLLRDVMNFTPIISTRDYVSIDSDHAKNWSDSLNDVIKGTANISTCSIPLGIDRLGVLDYTFPYFRVRLAWLAPPIATGPVWWRLLSPLNGYLWLVLLVLVFFVTSLPFIMKLRAVKIFSYRHFKNIRKLHGVAIRVWGVMLGQPIRVAPKRFRDFYIIGLWMWFTFVVRSAYQSVLIGALKTDNLVGNFDDLKQTIDYGYRYGGRAGIFAHFEHDQLIREGYEILSEEKFDETFYDVIEGNQRFVLATSLEYAWAYCLAQGKAENECGHVLPDSIMTVPLVVWMKMYSPLHKPLTVWLPRLIESGLLDRDAVQKPTCCISKSTEPTPLTRHQTLSCFICLLLGYLVSITVFVLEIVRYKSSLLKHHLVQKNKLCIIQKK